MADADAEGDVDAVAEAPVEVELLSTSWLAQGANCPRISPSGFWSV